MITNEEWNEEWKQLKFLVKGLSTNPEQLDLLPNHIVYLAQEIVAHYQAYELITLANDVYMNLVDYLHTKSTTPLYEATDEEIFSQLVYAIELLPILVNSKYSALRYTSNYLLSREHICDYKTKVTQLNTFMREYFSPIEFTKYISKGVNYE